MFGFLRRRQHGRHRAHFDVQRLSIEVATGQTLLQAALEAGLPYPHNCRVGSCKTCQCRLIAGKVKQLTDTSYVLDRSEREAGVILACQTHLLSDARIEVEWPDIGLPRAPIDGSIEAVRKLTPDIVEMTINLAEPMQYVAGQYAQIGVPSIGIARCYSFACAPDGGPQSRIQFYVRQVPGGTFTGWLSAARIGARVHVGGPRGTFVLSRSAAPLLFIAGGSGLAPIKAILEQASRDGCPRDATFLFGARTTRDLYALQEIEAIALSWTGRFQFVPILSHEAQRSTWSGERGLVVDGLATRIPDLHRREAYLCGPPAMVDAAVTALRASGVASEAIRSDSFFN